jgi:hypothetical protein
MDADHLNLQHLEEEKRKLFELLPNNISSNALAASVVSSGAHFLYGFTVSNTNAAAQYVLVFDLRVLPAEGAVPSIVFTVDGASDKGVQWLPPRKMLQGIVICNSSTPGTKTIGAADCFFDVQYL